MGFGSALDEESLRSRSSTHGLKLSSRSLPSNICIPRTVALSLPTAFMNGQFLMRSNVPSISSCPKANLLALPVTGNGIERRRGKRTFVIMTTEANDALRDFHHRMPVMLGRDEIAEWLEGGEKSVLKPYEDEIVHDIVSRIVNSPANNSEECIKPAADQGDEE